MALTETIQKWSELFWYAKVLPLALRDSSSRTHLRANEHHTRSIGLERSLVIYAWYNGSGPDKARIENSAGIDLASHAGLSTAEARLSAPNMQVTGRLLNTTQTREALQACVVSCFRSRRMVTRRSPSCRYRASKLILGDQ